jgi:multidrug efflux pump subunit AcrB/outer membrane protein TolC
MKKLLNISPEQNRGIGALSVKNPVLVNILMVTVIALGAFSMLRLPQEQFAEVPFYWVNIIVPYPGVSAEDLESSVTIPIENEFQGIDSLSGISSTTSEGLSVVRVEFDDGISQQKFDTLFQDAQTRFNRVDLPDGVLNPVVDDFSSADFAPVIEVVLSGDVPYPLLRNTALNFQDEILGISDVSSADIVGLREREIILNLSPERMAALGLSTTEILQAVQDRNTTVPGGTLSTEGSEFLLRTLSTIEGIEDFNDVIVRRGNGDSAVVRLRDVAQVIDGFDPDSGINRLNGDTSVALRVTKVPGGSSIDVVSGIQSFLDEAELPAGMTVTLLNDSTVQIKDSLSVLTSNAVMGLGLLVLILALFIGVRNALMTALGIPVTFALTFIVLELLGETLNTNTLFGLVLVLGLIVDHAIVIIENSYRMQQQGLSRHDAAIVGTNQVVWPVIAATGTTVAAFLPLMIIPGTIGRFLRVIPLTVAIALIASTGEALYFLPSHFADWGKEKRKNGKARREPGQWFNAIRIRFDGIFAKLYPRRGLVLIAALVIAIGSFALIPFLGQDLFAAEDFTYFTIDITMPRGTSIDRTDEVLARFEQRLLPRVGDGEVLSILSTGGSLSGQTSVSNSSNVAQINVDLTEAGEGRTRSIDEIIEEVRVELSTIPGPEEVLYRKATNGPPTAAPITFTLSGDEYGQLAGASDAITEFMRTRSGVFNIEDDFEAGNPELRVRVNPERATALGLSVISIGNFIRAKFDGLPVGRYFEDNEEIDIVMRYDAGRANDYDDLVQSLIPSPDGRLIPFSSVASVEYGTSAGSIRRVEGKRQITITADAAEGLDLAEVNGQVEQFVQASLVDVYPGVDFGIGGEFSEFQDLLIEILRVFILGIFLIYLILGAQFKSYSQPLIILLSVPFAFVGVILYLAISGTPFSTTVLYAGVALAGIAVNDAIVLISFINELRADGMNIGEAVRTAAGTRLRPIILTSLTTIVGLLPTAIGIGGQSVVWGPMASTIIFGLLFSTVTALIIIPSLYGVLYDRQGRGRKQGEGESGTGDEDSDESYASASASRTGGAAIASAWANPAVKTTALAMILGSVFLFAIPGTAAAQSSDADPTQAPVDIRLGGFLERTSEAGPGVISGDINSRLVESIVRRSDAMYASLFPGEVLSSFDGLYALLRSRVSRSADLQSLASVARIAQAGFEQTIRSALPQLSINSGQGSSALVTYSRGPGFTGFGSEGDQALDYGLNLGLEQALPTGGVLFGGAGLSLNSKKPDGEADWDYQLSPSLTFGVNQPLFLGGPFLSSDVMSAGFESARDERDAAADALDDSVRAISIQVLDLLATRAGLREQRFLLAEQLELQQLIVTQARQEFELGVISRSQLDSQETTLRLQENGIAALTSSIRELELNLAELLAAETAELDDLTDPYLLPDEASLAYTPDWEELEKILLERDADVLSARRQIAAARSSLFEAGNIDAPRLNLLLSLISPYEQQENLSDVFAGNREDNLTLSVTLDIPDPFRSSFRFQKQLYEESLIQAELALESARLALRNRIDAWRNERADLLAELDTAFDEYDLALNAWEQELVFFQRGGANEVTLKQAALSVHRQVFAILDKLRNLASMNQEIIRLSDAASQ